MRNIVQLSLYVGWSWKLAIFYLELLYVYLEFSQQSTALADSGYKTQVKQCIDIYKNRILADNK